MMLAAAAVLTTLTWIVAALGRPSRTEDTAERLAHVLGYLDTDYARFASSERSEHLAMIAEAGRLARKLPESVDVEKPVEAIGALIARGAAPGEVHTRVTQVREVLFVIGHVERAPRETLDGLHGRALYERHCAGCHGATGRADTQLAATLRPHPANFHDPVLGAALSPYDVTTAIRFGVDGTAMNAIPSLDEQERWDLAFYVVGLRHEGPVADDAPSFTASELARTSDEELGEALFAAGVGGARLSPTLRALRRQVAFEPPRPGSLPSARRELETARQALVHGDPRAALDAAVAARTRAMEGTSDPAVATQLSEAFATLTNRLRTESSPLGAVPAVQATLRLLTYVEHVTPDVRLPAPPTVSWPGNEEKPSEPLAANPGGPGLPCSAPGFGPGPVLHPTAGGLPFDVTHDCMYPGNDQLEVVLNVQGERRPGRAGVDALLRDLLEQVQHATGSRMPELTHITALSSDGATPYGRLEFDADEGPQGELGVLLLVPYEPGAWAESFTAAHARWVPANGKPEVTVDASGRELVVTTPLVDPEDDRGASHVSLADAAVQLFPWLFDFYPPRTEVQGITLRGTRQGKPVLEIHVTDLHAFLSMDPWPVRERMAAAGIPIEPQASRTPAQQRALGQEYARALARLPEGSVVFRPSASRLP
jgi:mono/diheme cytochrome c family protein